MISLIDCAIVELYKLSLSNTAFYTLDEAKFVLFFYFIELIIRAM